MPREYHQLMPGRKYYFHNKAVGSEKIFNSDRDYYLFLTKKIKHIDVIADTIAWCLLPNRIDFLFEIKPVDLINEQFKLVKKVKCPDETKLAIFLVERLSNWLNSYVKSINLKYTRDGSLFIDKSCRIEIADEDKLFDTLFRIHTLPEVERVVNHFNTWPFSSFGNFLSPEVISMPQLSVFTLFASLTDFIKLHNNYLKKSTGKREKIFT